jgi:hypothetical protein
MMQSWVAGWTHGLLARAGGARRVVVVVAVVVGVLAVQELLLVAANNRTLSTTALRYLAMGDSSSSSFSPWASPDTSVPTAVLHIPRRPDTVSGSTLPPAAVPTATTATVAEPTATTTMSGSAPPTAETGTATTDVAGTAAAAGGLGDPTAVTFLGTPASSARPHRVAVSLFWLPYRRDATAEEKAEALRSGTQPPGGITKYSFPLVNVILNWMWLLPDWGVRVYVPHGHPMARQLRALGAEVVEKSFDPARWCEAMTWRFLLEDDPAIDYWASREAESPPTYQDAAALRAWQRSGLHVHALYVRPAHVMWNGGLWGARRGFISGRIQSSMADAISVYRQVHDTPEALFGSRYGDDQIFMNKALWKALDGKHNGIAYAHGHLLENRTACSFSSCVPWPPYPGSPDGFMASVNAISVKELLLCHHREPPYCRRHRYKNAERAWRDLYELCVGTDFDTGALIPDAQRPRLGMAACPYAGVTPLDF